VVERVGAGVGAAIRKVFQPDAAADERLDSLLDQLRAIRGSKQESKQ
jgi:hypothetical protein